ncbi:hypothetical protein GcC1_098018, partial [Golovinomyces cichoracearum]
MAEDKSQSQAFTRVTNNNFDPIELGWDSCDFKPTTATKAELLAYLEWRINEYKQKHYSGYIMWETLYEDFENWTADSLLKAGRDLCRELREVLIQRGVKVEENSRIAISERIYKAITTEYTQYLVPQVPTENIEEFSGK